MSSETIGNEGQPQPDPVRQGVAPARAQHSQEDMPSQQHAPVKPAGEQQQQVGFVRALKIFPATAINMSQMLGVGPFITIPLILAAMGGPQAMLGWVIGAVIAMADGLVWSEKRDVRLILLTFTY